MSKNYGEGSIYYRKGRNKWIAQIYERDPITLERKCVRKSFNTEDEAREHLNYLMYKTENQSYINNNGIPVIEIMKTILQNKYDMNLISDAQYERVQRTIKKMADNPIVHKNVDEITPDELQQYVNTFSQFSDSTIKKNIAQFNQAFKYAFDKGYISRNPMAMIIKPRTKVQSKIVRAMTLDEEIKFVNYLQNQTLETCPYKNEYLIQLFMGLRIGECLALSETDIDLKHRSIFVHKTLTTDIDGLIRMSNSPKTKAGNRYLPISDSLYPYIIEQMRFCHSQPNNEEKLLFKPPHNRYTDRENVNRALSKILDKLGIEHMSSHSLRHTYATSSIEAGVTPVVLQKLMGHTDVSITLNTYTSVFDKYKETELEKVNQYYKSQNMLQSPNTTTTLLDEDNNVKEPIQLYER